MNKIPFILKRHTKMIDDDDMEGIDFGRNDKGFDDYIKSIRGLQPYGTSNALTVLHEAIENGKTNLITKNSAKFKKEFGYLKKLYGFNENQSLMIANIYNTMSYRFDLCRLMHNLSVSKLLISMYVKDVQGLIDKEYIFGTLNEHTDCHNLYKNMDALESMLKNIPYVHKDLSDMPVNKVLDDIKDITSSDDPRDFSEHYNRIILRYKEHPLIKNLFHISDALNEIDKKDEDYNNPDSDIPRKNTVSSILLIMVIQSIYSDMILEKDYLLHFITDIPCTADEYLSYLQKHTDNHTKFNGIEIFENHNNNGLAEPNTFRFTEELVTKVFNIMPKKVQEKPTINTDGNFVQDYNEIKEKELFYDDELKEQVDRLEGLLKQENFKNIQERLEKSNMRIGFNILLYGAAGTGKTETCKQLARITGRRIMNVEVSDFKDKFVGESEKHIKQLFNIYRNMVEEANEANEKVPIMLLNEADAIIGIRKKGADTAVDKMENAIQNIILNEMENIKGIMIATTNLTENLDSAFERRFIFKVKYTKPSPEVRGKIWKSNINTLTDEEAQTLGHKYDFSGGEIENISRKCTIENILTGEDISYDMIVKFAKNEKINDKGSHSVGFNREAC